MIKLLGLKRIVWIVSCILLCAGAGALLLYYIMPTLEQTNRDVMTTQAQIQAKQSEITRLKTEYAQLKDQIVQFKKISQKRFFNAQDRVTARETIRQLAEQTHLLRADLVLDPASIVNDPAATNANYNLISGPMKIEIEAVDDLDVYKFVVALQNIFPGYLEFKDLDITRPRDLTPDYIRSLSRKNPESMVTAKVSFSWWSMASQKQMEATPYFNPAGMPATTPPPIEEKPVPAAATGPSDPSVGTPAVQQGASPQQ